MVVKIVRPGIEQQIRQDIEVLMMLARMADRYWDEARRVKPIQIVREFETTILHELDLMREAANASTLRRQFRSFSRPVCALCLLGLLPVAGHGDGAHQRYPCLRYQAVAGA